MQEIILYSTGCPMCNVLKSKLSAKGIEYAEHNDVDEMLELGLMQVPVLCVDGQMLQFPDAVRWVNSQ